jgi:ionotropic glutamate receptor
MEHRYKSLLVNIPVRHIITALERTDAGIRNQTERIRAADVSTFFVVGTKDTITRVLTVVSDPRSNFN